MSPQQRAFAIAAHALAMTGQALFFVFLVLQGLERWPVAEPRTGAAPWIVNGVILILFAVQHSGMARTGFKSWLGRRFPNVSERTLYVALSGLFMFPLVFAWQPLPGEPIWRAPMWILIVLAAGALLVAGIALFFDHGAFLGLQPQDRAPRLIVSGPYRYVRHPLTLGLLLCLWAHPVMTPTLAMLSGGLTVYVFLAMPLEERDLRARFGTEYDDYRRRVPALIPWKW